MDHFGPSEDRFGSLGGKTLPFIISGTKEFRDRHFVISGPLEPPPPQKNDSVTSMSIPGGGHAIRQENATETSGSRVMGVSNPEN